MGSGTGPIQEPAVRSSVSSRLITSSKRAALAPPRPSRFHFGIRMAGYLRLEGPCFASGSARAYQLVYQVGPSTLKLAIVRDADEKAETTDGTADD